MLLRIEDQLHRVKAPLADPRPSPQPKLEHVTGHAPVPLVVRNQSTGGGPDAQSLETSLGLIAAGLGPALGVPCRVFRIKWPDVTSFQSSPPLNPICYEEAEDYIYREWQRAEALVGLPRDTLNVDVSPRNISRHQQAFAQNILGRIPLMDNEYLASTIDLAIARGFRGDDLSSPLTLLVLALGSFTSDVSNTSDEPSQFAGVEYFVYGFRQASQLMACSADIRAIQRDILICIYFQYTTRQLPARKAMARATSEISTLFKLTKRLEADRSFYCNAIRAYWACYVLDNEVNGRLCTQMKILTPMLEQMKLFVDGQEYEEYGNYFFCSAVALRRIHERAMDLVPFFGNGTGTIFAPLVAQELQNQLNAWYQHLPLMLKFPTQVTTAVLDPRLGFLRAQYFSALTITNWPYILKLLDTDAGPNPESAQQLDIDLETLIRHEELCIASAISYIRTLQGMMYLRHMTMGVSLRGLHTTSMMLLSIYEVPELAEIMVPGVAEAVTKAVAMLEIWSENSSVAVGVNRLRGIMADVGIGC